VQVETGISNPDQMEILSGVQKGQFVIVALESSIRDGTRIRVIAER
jgi:hypothetical protein